MVLLFENYEKPHNHNGRERIPYEEVLVNFYEKEYYFTHENKKE